jgi:hypothetical protein
MKNTPRTLGVNLPPSLSEVTSPISATQVHISQLNSQANPGTAGAYSPHIVHTQRWRSKCQFLSVATTICNRSAHASPHPLLIANLLQTLKPPGRWSTEAWKAAPSLPFSKKKPK